MENQCADVGKDLAQKALTSCIHKLFLLLCQLATAVAHSSAAALCAERCYSAINRIKCASRNRLSADSLNEMCKKSSDVVTEGVNSWLKAKRRRLQGPNHQSLSFKSKSSKVESDSDLASRH